MIAAALTLNVAAALAATSPFTVETLAPGIDVYRGDPRLGYANSLVIDRADGLAIVDAQPSPSAATELLQAIAARTPKRPRYLIMSHPHVESIGGASAFPDTVLRIGSLGCALALRDPEFDFAAEARARANKPQDYRPPPQVSPVMVVEGPATLDDPAHPIQLFPLPPADTEGDLLVSLHEPGILFVGDLLAWEGNPYPGNASIDGWIARINAVVTMKPNIVVPARGPVADADALRRQRDSFLWVRGQISKAFVDLVPTGQMPKRVLDHKEFTKFFNPPAEHSFIPALVDQILHEAEVERSRRGLP